MEKHIYWKPVSEPGLEHLILTETANGWQANGLILRMLQGAPLRLEYVITCDHDWRARSASVTMLGAAPQTLTIIKDPRGCWLDTEGKPINLLEGCVDVDLSATPFTNTLPIKRLDLAPGQELVIQAAFLAVPEMELRRSPQRYMCISRDADGGAYRYQSLITGETFELTMDADGIVRDYQSVFTRIWP